MYELFCQRLRQQMIDSGVLNPSQVQYSGFDRPHLSSEQVQRLKARYIAAGLIRPKPPRTQIVLH